MAPGVNSYLFANQFGVAKRVCASSLLAGTAHAVLVDVDAVEVGTVVAGETPAGVTVTSAAFDDFLVGQFGKPAGVQVGQALVLFDDHAAPADVVQALLQAIDGQRPALTIHGTDYDTPDGTCIRDYIHVRDLAEAHALAVAWADQPGFTALNLGTGTGYTVREVVQACRAVTGHPIPAVEQPRRPGDPPELVASNQRAAQRLGWTTEHGLERIVADAWAFMSTT